MGYFQPNRNWEQEPVGFDYFYLAGGDDICGSVGDTGYTSKELVRYSGFAINSSPRKHVM